MKQLAIHTLVSPPLEVNSYVVADEKARRAVAIDPGFVADEILDFCAKRQWTLEAVILTHGHIDHIHDAVKLARAAEAEIICHPMAAPLLASADLCGATWLNMDFEPFTPDLLVEHRESILVGDGELQVLHTPGHTAGCVCLLSEGFCVTGDLLFRDGVGRWDFPGGNQKTLIESLRLLKRLCPSQATLYPGHGPSTTLERELRENPYLLEWLAE
jgi:glyoxylase-like metal-dependent hydrolase (beta-lactamase superfamily II)